MKKSAYFTFDNIDVNNGAGLVCYHETRALSRVTDLICLHTREKINKIYPLDKYYDFNPFMYDYFASMSHECFESIDLLHLSCSPGTGIWSSLKPKHYVCNIVAHDLKVSIDEHERYYGKGSYKFVHNTDNMLHFQLLKHVSGADVILTPSSTSAEWIENNIKYKRGKVVIIPHGTEIPEAYGEFPSKFTIGYLGAAGPDKGLPYLYEASQKVVQENTEMLWAGSCKGFINSVFPREKTTGWLDKVSDFYNMISVYVQPSVTEGFGIEIVEAMAYGRPVIASRGAGGADAITDGYDGFVVPPRDIEALSLRLQFLKEYPEISKIMGQRAREKAKQYSWDLIEEKYKKMYSEVLEEK